MASLLVARAVRLVGSRSAGFCPSVLRPVSTVACVRQDRVASVKKFDKYSHLPIRVSLPPVFVARFATETKASDAPKAASYGPADPHAIVTEGKQNLAKGNTLEAWGLHENAGAIGSAGIFKKYGLVPTALFALAALVSKEMLILDEEMVVAFCFGSFVFSGYTFMGDTIGKSLDDEAALIRAEQEGALDARIAALESAIQVYRDTTNITGILHDLKNEYTRLLDGYTATMTTRLQDKTMRFVERRLQDIANGEAEMKNRVAAKMITASTSFVQKRVRDGDPKLKESFFNASLARLEGRATKVVDPIRQLYQEFFKTFQQKQQARYGKKIKASAAAIDIQKVNQQKLITKFKEEFGVTIKPRPEAVLTEVPFKYRI